MTYEVPFVSKQNVTLISIGDSLEAVSLRAILESYNYRVRVHWVGSRKELLKILCGEITTDEMLILSCHGVEEGIVIPDEPTLTANEIEGTAKLHSKIIVNLGCKTGSKEFIQAFKAAQANHYVAPVDYPDGKAAVAFVANLFLLLSSDIEIGKAVDRAANFDATTEQFQLPL